MTAFQPQLVELVRQSTQFAWMEHANVEVGVPVAVAVGVKEGDGELIL